MSTPIGGPLAGPAPQFLSGRRDNERLAKHRRQDGPRPVPRTAAELAVDYSSAFLLSSSMLPVPAYSKKVPAGGQQRAAASRAAGADGDAASAGSAADGQSGRPRRSHSASRTQSSSDSFITRTRRLSSRHSRTSSSGSQPTSRTSLEAPPPSSPLGHSDRPADAAVGHRQQLLLPPPGSSPAAAPPPGPLAASSHAAATSSSPPPPPPPPSSSSASPPLAQRESAFRRASHSFIHRGRTSDGGRSADNRHALALARSNAFALAHASAHPSGPRLAPIRPMTGLVPLAALRSEFISTPGESASSMSQTVASTDGSASRENLLSSKPFVLRNGRAYLNDSSLSYPLPADLTELHRQSMRTLLLIQVFGAPVCSPVFSKRPPQRVLEIGCGSGFWSMMCYRFFKARGHSSLSFTGIDIAPLAPTNQGSSSGSSGGGGAAGAAAKPDPDMKWNFVSHDLRQLPWPLPNDEYDLVMVKDMSLATTNLQNQDFVDEYLRLLRPGGVLEIWESDHLIRMLRPHVPEAGLTGEDAEEQETATSLGAYVMNPNTPLSAPLNPYLIEYNQWLSKALESLDLTAVPCTLIGPVLLQESELLTDVKSRRLAIPLSEVRWEREGVGGVVTKDTRGSHRPKDKTPAPNTEEKLLTTGQEALRKTALLTVVQQVQALEPILREAAGKSQDEWDGWLGKMMANLVSESGTSWGECLEVGAWWATKQKA